MISYLYWLRGKVGTIIQPSYNEHKIYSYDLLGYGADNNAKLQNYFYHIPQDESDYKNFVASMKQSEDLLKKQFQPIISRQMSLG